MNKRKIAAQNRAKKQHKEIIKKWKIKIGELIKKGIIKPRRKR